MTDWKEHWATVPRAVGPAEYLRQVGKTFKGEPISPAQVDAHIEDACAALDLGPDDILLDLCCGNGVITTRLATRCRRVVGVDYSEPLIDVARQVHSAPSISYHCAPVQALDHAWLSAHGPFTRVLMSEALQHFQEWELREMVETLASASPAPSAIAFTGVPDYRRKWNFYSTPEWRRDYLTRLKEGRDALGTWWAMEHFEDVALRFGLTCHVLSQNPILHSAHYRMDVVLRTRA